jgi:chemotaxis protein CheZ
MSANTNVHVSLEEAKLLVEYLESGQQDKADELIAEIQNPINSELFVEIVNYMTH